jgi:exodeoxyribonuclease-3
LRLLSYNIRFGGVGRVDALAAVVSASEADLVLLQEATRPDVVEKLAAATGMAGWGAFPGRSVAFMSRRKVASHRWHRTPPSRRSFLEVVLPGTPFRVFDVHLSAVHSNWTERLRALEVRAVIDGIKKAQHGFHVVVGDFNTLAPGAKLDVARLPPRLRAFVWVTGRKIRWRTVQLMLDATYADGFRSLHPADPGYTFQAWNPHIRLDYLFLPQAGLDRLRRCEVVNDGVDFLKDASDHLPLLAELDAR